MNCTTEYAISPYGQNRYIFNISFSFCKIYAILLSINLQPSAGLKGRRGHTREENLMDHRNLTLLTDLYELTMMQGYFKEKDANETVIFDMFYRNNPHGNGFAVCAGLDQVIEYIRESSFR